MYNKKRAIVVSLLVAAVTAVSVTATACSNDTAGEAAAATANETTSGTESGTAKETATAAVSDAGLATQAMNAAALALGYGTKIISSPTSVLNGEKQDDYRELLGIPEDMETVGMLLVGEALDTSDLDPDSITAATTRNSYDEMTTYLP